MTKIDPSFIHNPERSDECYEIQAPPSVEMVKIENGDSLTPSKTSKLKIPEFWQTKDLNVSLSNDIPQLATADPVNFNNASIENDLDHLQTFFSQFEDRMKKDPSNAGELILTVLMSLLNRQKGLYEQLSVESSNHVLEQQSLLKEIQRKQAIEQEKVGTYAEKYAYVNQANQVVSVATVAVTLAALYFKPSISTASGVLQAVLMILKLGTSVTEAHVKHTLQTHESQATLLKHQREVVQHRVEVSVDDTKQMIQSMAKILSIMRDSLSSEYQTATLFVR